ncbi:hypothetical protein [Prosthecobacter sp.]|nr:hypothetical protein [Prosthecobacter sp.]
MTVAIATREDEDGQSLPFNGITFTPIASSSAVPIWRVLSSTG